ncbi:anthranilate synthase component I family protein, partial [Bacillus haikouensis]|uniref:anthranilate synthase component I family protein n=1 Tax=Bacillus haikouensis TaxID=1510468 RepID=UPI00155649AC
SLWQEHLAEKEAEEFTPLNEGASGIRVSMNEEQFSNAVKRIQDYISQGDVFQVNLSVRQSQELGAEPLAVYKKLRELNPSPYMSYIQTPEFQIVSGSPELLVKKKGLEVSTRPIAGTRSRGKDAAEDEALAGELIDNEKERAEHVMLVDLERNDLGRVCRYGTVEVNEFMVIEKYSHVMHIVSNVRGTLDEHKTGADVIRSVFPGGTITGAPKIRTMEIIEELEPLRRGIYTGSIGWIGVNGDMELNIVIRTMLVKNNEAYIQAGAGVVIDSNPKYEYKESLKKAMALWVAKARAEGKGERL